MTGAVRAWVARVPGGTAGLADDLRGGRARTGGLGNPVRPDGVDAGRWRRMSRLARFLTGAAAELLLAHPDVDRSAIPVVHGTAMGEVVPSSAFLDRLFAEGPATASPLAFQGSVANATAAHVGLALGLTGPSETVSAGMATGLAALARAFEHLHRAPVVLLLLGDDDNPTTARAYANTDGFVGELVLAALITAGDAICVVDGERATDGPRFARGTALPYERSFVPRPGVRPEACLGLHPSAGLLALLATGLPVLDQDDGLALTAWRSPQDARAPAH